MVKQSNKGEVKPVRKRGGQDGNKNAEVWDRETVVGLLEKVKKEAIKPNCLYLGSALVACSLYREIWSRWKDKYKEDEFVCQTIKEVEQIFEGRLFEKALKNEVNATVAIFGLKNNHGWVDKTETKTEGSMTINWQDNTGE